MIRVFWIDIEYACFGIASKDNIIFEAPPIVHWMIGKMLQHVKPWLLKKKAKVIEIHAKQT